MWPFKSKKEKRRIKEEKLEANLRDIAGVGPNSSNGYRKYCAHCGRNFSYWYSHIISKMCPDCTYRNFDYGEIMIATKSGHKPDYNAAIYWLRESKNPNKKKHYP
jgi:hypothetical protein